MTHTIKPTAEEFATIRATARAALNKQGRGLARVEIGLRFSLSNAGEPSANILLVDPTKDWEDSDLYDFMTWAELRAKGVPADSMGRAVIDCYCYSSEGLEDNIQALFIDGRLVWCGTMGDFGFTAFGPEALQDFDPTPAAPAPMAQPVQQQQARAAAPAKAAPVVTLDSNWQGLARRVPNKTGQGSHRFTTGANVAANGREYRAAVYQTHRACNLQTVEVTLYLNGRTIPESQLQAVRAAVVAAYVEAFGLLPHDAETTAPAPAPAAPIKVATIDLTPTWESLVPAFVAMIENGTPQSRGVAIEELTRLARFADKTLAANKAA